MHFRELLSSYGDHQGDVDGLHVEDMQIDDCTFEDMRIAYATFRRVAFKHVRFFRSQLLDVTFDRCTFVDVDIIDSSLDQLLLIDCTMDRVRCDRAIGYGSSCIRTTCDHLDVQDSDLSAYSLLSTRFRDSALKNLRIISLNLFSCDMAGIRGEKIQIDDVCYDDETIWSRNLDIEHLSAAKNMSERSTAHAALLGAPMVGKTTLLRAIAAHMGGADLRAVHCSFMGQGYSEASVSAACGAIDIATMTGGYLSEDLIFFRLLRCADMVIYVYSAALGGEAIQSAALRRIVLLASALRKTWDSIPWLLVLNKSDLADVPPLFPDLPPIQGMPALPAVAPRDLIPPHVPAVACVATEGVGVADVCALLPR